MNDTTTLVPECTVFDRPTVPAPAPEEPSEESVVTPTEPSKEVPSPYLGLAADVSRILAALAEEEKNLP